MLNLLQRTPVGNLSEILIASPDARPAGFGSNHGRVRWLQTSRSARRAAQMNDAARVAEGKWLWFLHADSQLREREVRALAESLARAPSALHYFDLQFFDGPALLKINEWGAAVRSRFFGMPFGDQGFCMPRKLFEELGGFCETVLYGEDHLLVWKARRNGVRLNRVPATIRTSGRKYRDQGWVKTTVRHQVLTWLQAFPRILEHWESRRGGSR